MGAQAGVHCRRHHQLPTCLPKRCRRRSGGSALDRSVVQVGEVVVVVVVLRVVAEAVAAVLVVVVEAVGTRLHQRCKCPWQRKVRLLSTVPCRDGGGHTSPTGRRHPRQPMHPQPRRRCRPS